jgi:hypothetical protein
MKRRADTTGTRCRIGTRHSGTPGSAAGQSPRARPAHRSRDHSQPADHLPSNSRQHWMRRVVEGKGFIEADHHFRGICARPLCKPRPFAVSHATRRHQSRRVPTLASEAAAVPQRAGHALAARGAPGGGARGAGRRQDVQVARGRLKVMVRIDRYQRPQASSLVGLLPLRRDGLRPFSADPNRSVIDSPTSQVRPAMLERGRSYRSR